MIVTHNLPEEAVLFRELPKGTLPKSKRVEGAFTLTDILRSEGISVPVLLHLKVRSSVEPRSIRYWRVLPLQDEQADQLDLLLTPVSEGSRATVGGMRLYLGGHTAQVRFVQIKSRIESDQGMTHLDKRLRRLRLANHEKTRLQDSP